MHCPRCHHKVPVTDYTCNICGKELPLRYVRHLMMAGIFGAIIACVVYVMPF